MYTRENHMRSVDKDKNTNTSRGRMIEKLIFLKQRPGQMENFLSIAEI